MTSRSAHEGPQPSARRGVHEYPSHYGTERALSSSSLWDHLGPKRGRPRLCEQTVTQWFNQCSSFAASRPKLPADFASWTLAWRLLAGSHVHSGILRTPMRSFAPPVAFTSITSSTFAVSARSDDAPKPSGEWHSHLFTLAPLHCCSTWGQVALSLIHISEPTRPY